MLEKARVQFASAPLPTVKSKLWTIEQTGTENRGLLLNIAHRGASGDFAENTLAAFEAAIAAGADMCELDVQLTADGAAVVIHDDTVDRTTGGRGAVKAMTLAQIRALDTADGAGIPTLEEVLQLVRGRCGLNVELKAPGVQDEVCRLLRGHDAIASTIVSSFDWDALAAARRIDPQLSLGVLADRRAEAMFTAACELRAASVHPRHDLVSEAMVARAHRMGFKVLVWTVDRPGRMRRLMAMGVDGIMTNYPARLAALMREEAPH